MKLTTGKKLGLGFGIVLALMVFSSGMAYLKSASIKRSQDLTVELRFPSLTIVKDLQRDLNQTQNKGRQTVLAGADPAKREAAKKLFDAAWGEIEKDMAAMDELAPKWVIQANRDRLAEIKPQLLSLRAAQEAAMNHAASGERDAVAKAGDEFADQATPANEAIKKSLGGMADSFGALLAKNTEDLHAENNSLNLTMAVATFAGVFIGIVVAFFIIRDISAGAKREKLAADEVAQGAERERLAAQELTQKVDSILSCGLGCGPGRSYPGDSGARQRCHRANGRRTCQVFRRSASKHGQHRSQRHEPGVGV